MSQKHISCLWLILIASMPQAGLFEKATRYFERMMTQGFQFGKGS